MAAGDHEASDLGSANYGRDNDSSAGIAGGSMGSAPSIRTGWRGMMRPTGWTSGRWLTGSLR